MIRTKLVDCAPTPEVVLTTGVVEQVVNLWVNSLIRTAKRHVIWPKDLMQLLQVFLQVSDELCVKFIRPRILLSGLHYSFQRVVLEPFGHLFASPWNPVSGSGGTLRFECDELIVKGRIDMDYGGYKGGKDGRQGESYTGIGQQFVLEPNGGGGGYRGHAGYGSCGLSTLRSGGMMYGSPELSTLYLGSGGGSGFDERKRGRHKYTVGGNGGGIVDITVRNNLRITSGGMISANGEKGKSQSGAGAGSGGSIRIVCEGKVHLSGHLSAKGGHNAGNGRIAIFCKQTPYISRRAVYSPLPFIQVNSVKKSFTLLKYNTLIDKKR